MKSAAFLMDSWFRFAEFVFGFLMVDSSILFNS
jgi:hypothetical protein